MIHKYDWYKKRKYKHFDKPLPENQAAELVKSQSEICKHGFYPFISTIISTPRYKNCKHKNEPKERKIAYAAHSDSHIFAYYAYELSKQYDKIIQERGISESIIAYRKFIPKKCNIDFADEVFEYIRKTGNCCVLSFDVEDFFGNINHHILKERWCTILEKDCLPNDHYSIYKHITKYSYVDRQSIFRLFHIGDRRANQYWKPICSPREFRDIIRDGGYIGQNKCIEGIPQGSPISAVLSNIYMLEFDTEIAKNCKNIGALYRRYSDDILFVVSESKKDYIHKVLNSELEKVKLKLNEKKTKISIFTIGEDTNILLADKPIQYLGFLFDGKRKLVRSQTIARYLGKMRRAVYFADVAACKACRRGKDPRIYKRKILRKYSLLGQSSNYPHYANRARIIMNSTDIKHQHRRHWRVLNELLQRPICKEPCSLCVKGTLNEYRNQLGHGVIVSRNVFCPYAN